MEEAALDVLLGTEVEGVGKAELVKVGDGNSDDMALVDIEGSGGSDDMVLEDTVGSGGSDDMALEG